MTIKVTSLAIDSADLLDYMQEEKELVLPRRFTVTTDAECDLVTLCYKNKTVVFASAYLCLDNNKPALSVQVNELLNADMDCDEQEYIVTTTQEAGAVIYKAFEAKINQIISAQ